MKKKLKLTKKIVVQITGLLVALASVLSLMSCSTLYPVAGATLGGGVGAIAGIPGAAVGAGAGAAVGNIIDADTRLGESEDDMRAIMEQLIGTASEESRQAAMQMVQESSASMFDELVELFVTIAKWLMLFTVIYVVAKIILTKKQERRIAETFKRLTEEEWEYEEE